MLPITVKHISFGVCSSLSRVCFLLKLIWHHKGHPVMIAPVLKKKIHLASGHDKSLKQECPTSSYYSLPIIVILVVFVGKRSSFVLAMTTVWNKVVELYDCVTILLWRLAEIHIHKLVMLAIFILCILEVRWTVCRISLACVCLHNVMFMCDLYHL